MATMATSTEIPAAVAAPGFQSSSCQFCGDNIEPGGGARLTVCQHIFCRNCLTTYVTSQLQSSSLESVACPGLCGIKCTGNITDSEIKTLVPPALYQEYWERLQLSKALKTKKFVQCKNVRCGGWFDTGSNTPESTFCCPLCNTRSVTDSQTNNPSNNNGTAEDEYVSSEDNVSSSPSPSSSSVPCSDSASISEIEMDSKDDLAICLFPNERAEPDLTEDEPSCAFCSCTFTAIEDAIMLQTCSHVFCRNCLTYAIKNQSGCQIPCLIADQAGCDGYVTDSEVKALIQPAEYDEYLNRSVFQVKQGMENIFTCTSPDCNGWCEFEVGRKTFLCPVCNQSNCLECRCIHDGMTCEVYQKLRETGQHSKVAEIMEKERKNGWSQLAQQASQGPGLGEMLVKDLLTNTMEFECLICFTDVAVGEGVILQDCLHMFCKECLSGVVENNEEPTAKCPYMDGNYSCVCQMQEREIKALVTPEVYEKHLMRSMKLGESSIANSFHCKTPDCPGWCEYDGNVKRFECVNCGKSNCIKCNAQHEGVSCKDYKNRIKQNANDKLSEEALEKLIKEGQYMRCPKCKIAVQKSVGCDWIVCSCCKTEICWVTRGPRWGPGGRGDTSGGCKCQLSKGGKPCHPKCGNCH